MFESERLDKLAAHSGTFSKSLAPYLDEFAEKAGINTPLRRAHFIAQLCHESGKFSHMVENLNYSAERIAQVWPRLKKRATELAHKPEALANAAYADRLGNGNEASGDGWRYRGRGPIQTTGRDNYKAGGDAIGVDLVATPELAGGPKIGVRLALFYWNSRGCNKPADKDDVEQVTRKINGGLTGLEDRQKLTTRAKTIFVEAEPLIA